MVGYDNDWLVVSPHALRYWEKLFLEPYSDQRDVVYLAIIPDEDRVVEDARIFFRELSSVFEVSTHLIGRSNCLFVVLYILIISINDAIVN